MYGTCSSLLVAALVLLCGGTAFPDTSYSKDICRDGLDLVILVDASHSVPPEQLQKAKDFLAKVIDRLEVREHRTRVALSLFADTTYHQWCFDHHLDNWHLKEAVRNLSCPFCQRGNTVIGQALAHTREHTFQSECGARDSWLVTRVVVVLTDGKSTEEKRLNFPVHWVSYQAQKLKSETSAFIFAVGIGDYSLDDLLQVTHDQNAVFTTEEDQKLVATFNHVCQKPGRMAQFSTVVTEDEMCDVKMDLVFLVDKSASIMPHQWEMEKNFVAEMIDHFDVREGGTHVALTLFANWVRFKWCFNKHASRKSLYQAVLDLKCKNCLEGKTAIGRSLWFTKEKILTSECGVRGSHVPKVIVLLTDGRSTEARDYWVKQAAALKDTGAHVLAIGVGGNKKYNMKQLLEIASSPDLVFEVKHFDELMRKIHDISNATCAAGLLRTGNCPDLWHYNVVTKQCYRWFDEKVEFESLLHSCQMHGAMPVRSENFPLHHYLRVHSPSEDSYWLYMKRTPNGWYWWNPVELRRKPVTWTNWQWASSSRPDIPKQDGDCAVVGGGYGRKWKDVQCAHKFKYICTKPRIRYM